MIFSPSKNAFYAQEFKEDYENAGTWPDDGVEVTNEIFAEFKDEKEGFIRVVGEDKLPKWEDKPSEEPSDDIVKIRRKALYSDVSQGSDVLFAEALRYQLQGDDANYKATLEKAQARYLEIKNSIPYSAKPE